MKACTKCLTSHPVTFFNKDRTRDDGLYPQCKDCSRASCRRVYAENHEKHVALKRAWKNANRDRHREINREYRIANPERNRAGSSRYKARLKRATPPWVKPDALKQFKQFCPPGYHVDHVHPLCGANFSGLNVPWNWQYLPAEEHWKKGTRLLASAGGCDNL